MFTRSISLAAPAPIRLLALDVDGTLAVTGHEISAPTRDALTELRSRGETEIVLCSGRRYRGTLPILESLGFPAYTICNGGALTKDPQARTLDCAYLNPSTVLDLARIARSHGFALIGQRDSHAHGGPDFVVDDGVEWNDVTRDYLERSQEFGNAASLADHPHPADFLILGAFGDHLDLRRMAGDIGQRYGRDLATVIVPSVLQRSWYCQITLIDVDKWTALKFLAAELGIPTASVCAVGDELNDLPMIIGAGVGVAMGDGNPALHAHADWVCGNHDQDGLLEVIEFIRRRNAG